MKKIWLISYENYKDLKDIKPESWTGNLREKRSKELIMKKKKQYFASNKNGIKWNRSSKIKEKYLGDFKNIY